MALLNAFRARQCSARTAATLDEAFVELVLFAPDVLVSDVFMPDVDLGLLARVFRSLAHGRLNLLVLVSGTTGPELAARVKDVQPDLFVPKISGSASVVDKVMALHGPAPQSTCK
jgi:CheY-like chemotaxis protein